MPESRVHSGISRHWRAPALLTGITLVSGATPVHSTVERSHGQVREVRRVRARVADGRREIDRQQRAAVATAVAGLLSSVRARQHRTAEVCQRPLSSVVTLASVEVPPTEAADAFAVETSLTRSCADEAHSLPTLWPVRGAVSSSFGWRRSPYGGAVEWHPGIDIFAAYGTPVRAAGDGRVVSAGSVGEYGALVVVDHGRATTRYAHLSAIWVRPGQTVVRGEPLGAVGETGRATAPHLHYEVRVGRQPLDPECLLTKPEETSLAVGNRRSRACALVRARFGEPATLARTSDARPPEPYTREPGELAIATIGRGARAAWTPSSSRRE